MQLLDLPSPQVIEEFDFETIKQRKLQKIIELQAQKGIEYIPSDSDEIVTIVEMDAYEEMLLRTQFNNRIKAQLLAFAKGSDLDHLGATRFGVIRLEGAKPYANFTFTLSIVLDYNITLPKGMQLSDGAGVFATLLEDVNISAGSLSGDGVVELQLVCESSDIVTETIVTPLPYIVKATQNAPFSNGANSEDDERFRERIWLSRERKSTAGSMITYKYYATTADARVADVQIISDYAGVVDVYLLSVDGEADGVMIERVQTALTDEKVRPLTDKVTVYSATIVDVVIDADIVLKDMSFESEVRALIEESFKNETMIFANSLSLAKIYGLLESQNVKDVTLNLPLSSVNIAKNEVIRISEFRLRFSEGA